MTITSEKPNPQPLTADHSIHLHSASANQLTTEWLQWALRYLSYLANKGERFALKRLYVILKLPCMLKWWCNPSVIFVIFGKVYLFVGSPWLAATCTNACETRQRQVSTLINTVSEDELIHELSCKILCLVKTLVLQSTVYFSVLRNAGVSVRDLSIMD